MTNLSVRLSDLQAVLSAITLTPRSLTWQLTGLDGWYDLSGSKAMLVESPARPGAFYDPTAARNSATYRIGVRYTGTPEATAAAIVQLRALAALPRFRVAVTDHDFATQRNAYAANLRVTKVHDPCTEFEATIDCVSPDPRRYDTNSAWRSIGQRATITNAGTAPYSPIIEVSGVSGLVTVTEQETGRYMQVKTPLTLSQTARFDRSVGTLLVNEQPVLSGGTLQWPEIPAGATYTYLTNNVGTIRVLERSAWW